MTPSPERDRQLERIAHHALRELPVRRAPQTLETRVAAEIARRAALPWWKKSFVHWPLAARAAFVLLSAGGVKILLMASIWASAGAESAPFSHALATPVAWMDNLRTVGHATGDFVGILVRNIPALWLYAGLAVVAAIYAAFFGLGAAAYKLLSARR